MRVDASPGGCSSAQGVTDVICQTVTVRNPELHQAAAAEADSLQC